MDKQTVAQLFKAMRLSNKRERTANTCNTADAIPMHYAKYICYLCACVCVQLCLTLCAVPWTVAHLSGIFQARILEWLPFPPPGDLPDSGVEPAFPALQADSLPLSHLGSPSLFFYVII